MTHQPAPPVADGDLTTVLRQLRPIIREHPRRTPGSVVLDGVRLRYVDLHSFYWQALQIMEQRLYDFRSDEPSPLIIDCGAHVGLASAFFKSRFPRSSILAFEPDPSIAGMLRDNLRALGHDDVAVEAKAVWTDDRGVTFLRSHDDSGHVVSGTAAAGTGETVPSVRLRDVLAAQERPVDLLKMDLEGAEFALLRDCDGALGAVRRLIVEVHCLRPSDDAGKDGGPGRNGLGDVLAILSRNGFRTVLHDLHHAVWEEPVLPTPFPVVATGRYIVTVYAWR